MSEAVPYELGPNGEVIPINVPAMLNGISQSPMGQDPNALPPVMPQFNLPPKPQMSLDFNRPMNPVQAAATPAPISTEMSPNLVAPPEPTLGDKAAKAAKAIGNLTPDQVRSIQAMTGMVDRPAPPAAAAAIPRGQTGPMQQYSMAPSRDRKTLGQLINNR